MAEMRLEKELKKKNEKIQKLKAAGELEKAEAMQKEIDDNNAANEKFQSDKKQKLKEKREKQKEE